MCVCAKALITMPRRRGDGKKGFHASRSLFYGGRKSERKYGDDHNISVSDDSDKDPDFMPINSDDSLSDNPDSPLGIEEEEHEDNEPVASGSGTRDDATSGPRVVSGSEGVGDGDAAVVVGVGDGDNSIDL